MEVVVKREYTKKAKKGEENPKPKREKEEGGMGENPPNIFILLKLQLRSSIFHEFLA